MSVSVRNIKKFLDDNPNLEINKTSILKKVSQLSVKNIISVADVKLILGKHSNLFFDIMMDNPDHIKIWNEDVHK